MFDESYKRAKNATQYKILKYLILRKKFIAYYEITNGDFGSVKNYAIRD